MNKRKYGILHIVSHLGGGVGRVLLNYFAKVKDDRYYLHKLACLDYANEHACNVAKHIGLNMTDKMSGKGRQLHIMIAEADIVVIHWWNHPLLYDYLVRTEMPPCRVLMWSHISGFHPPYVFTEKLFRYPNIFVFTTPVSYKTRDAQNLPDEIKKKLRVVWSTGGVEHVKDVKLVPHDTFNVGYVGTVDYCKMHPNYLKICARVDVPNVKFIVCGGPKEKEIQQEAEYLGISGKFTFTGLVDNIAKYMSSFDVFGYPLAPYHYGTCDQALAESMACGVVPVVFSNRMENQMVKDGVTGMVVNNIEDYSNAIRTLYSDVELRAHLSENAREYARKSYSLEMLRREWDKVFEDILVFPKIARKWEIDKPNADISAKDVFLESLGEYGQEFVLYCNASSGLDKEISLKRIRELALSPIWQARTRGTVHHYHECFPDDDHLALWSRSMKEYEACNKMGERCRKIQ